MTRSSTHRDASGEPAGERSDELAATDLARLRPLAAALRAARSVAARGGPPALIPVTGDLAAGGAGAGRARGGGGGGGVGGGEGGGRGRGGGGGGGADDVGGGGEGGGVGVGELTGILAGTFNPLTVAHTALAEAGREHGCGRVILAMAPVSLAKADLERAHALDRLDWLVAWAATRPWASVAVASHPLLVDMAEAAGRAVPPVRPGGTGAAGAAGGISWTGGTVHPGVALLIGADKAVQLADPSWYPDPRTAFGRLGRAAVIMVAERDGHPLPGLPFPVTPLPTPAWVAERSATAARAAVAAGRPLDGLVPEAIAERVLATAAFADDPTAYQHRARSLRALLDTTDPER